MSSPFSSQPIIIPLTPSTLLTLGHIPFNFYTSTFARSQSPSRLPRTPTRILSTYIFILNTMLQSPSIFPLILCQVIIPLYLPPQFTPGHNFLYSSPSNYERAHSPFIFSSHIRSQSSVSHSNLLLLCLNCYWGRPLFHAVIMFCPLPLLYPNQAASCLS